MHREDNIMDFENFVASIVKEKFQQIDEEAADAREQQGIAQVGLGTRPMSDRPGLAKEDDEVKTEKVSTATRVISDMSDYYQPEEFPTQEVRIDNAPRFSNINKSTVLDILSANRDGLEKQGIIKMPMGMLRQPDPTLDIDGLQSRILDKLDLRPPEGSEQDIQYAYDPMRLPMLEEMDDDKISVDRDTPAVDEVQLDPLGKDIDLTDALNKILVAEGGFQNNPKDDGNYANGVLIGTNRGITPAALANYKNVNISTITVDDIRGVTEETAKEIFKRDYYYKPKINTLPEYLQPAIFDMQIHSGPNAIRILQRIIGVKDDGIIGPITLNALASRPVSLNEYADGRIKFYNSIVENNPDKKEFIKGWRARANSYRK